MMIANVIWHLENQFIVGLMLLITHIVIFGSMVTLMYYLLSALDSYIGKLVDFIVGIGIRLDRSNHKTINGFRFL